jgi:hypothetical protein
MKRAHSGSLPGSIWSNVLSARWIAARHALRSPSAACARFERVQVRERGRRPVAA